MTANKLYETTVAMMYEYDRRTGETAAHEIINNPWSWEKTTLFPFYSAGAQILIDCLQQMDKTAGRGSVAAAVKAIVKEGTRQPNRDLHGLAEQAGVFYACDSKRLIALNEDLAGVQHCGSTLEYAKIVTGARNAAVNEAELPELTALKAYISRCKAAEKLTGEKYCYRLSSGHYVNPEYLLTMMQALPGCRVYAPEKLTGVLYFEAENGAGVLCPVNPNCAAEIQ